MKKLIVVALLSLVSTASYAQKSFQQTMDEVITACYEAGYNVGKNENELKVLQAKVRRTQAEEARLKALQVYQARVQSCVRTSN